MERIGIFGGSFNPIHKGHILSAKGFMEELTLKKVIFVPSNIPPHKEKLFSVSDEDRVELLRLSLEEEKDFEVSLFELQKTEVSYTYYTLKEMKERYPEAELFFLVGTDMLEILDKWYKYEEIINMATFVCAPREKDDEERLRCKKEELSSDGCRVEILNTNPFPVSSSFIRNGIKEKKDMSEYLPAKVWEYIREKGLYV